MQELRIARSKVGMTLIELEAASGVGASTISKIERGVTRPQAATVRKLANALGIEVGELYPKVQAQLPDFENERRESKTPEVVHHDPYRWVQDKTTEELQQLGLEEARFAKPQTVEELFEGHRTDRDAQLKEAHRRVMAIPRIRNIIGELELRGASAAVKTIKLAIKQYDEFMNPPEEIPQQSHEEQEGQETA